MNYDHCQLLEEFMFSTNLDYVQHEGQALITDQHQELNQDQHQSPILLSPPSLSSSSSSSQELQLHQNPQGDRSAMISPDAIMAANEVTDTLTTINRPWTASSNFNSAHKLSPSPSFYSSTPALLDYSSQTHNCLITHRSTIQECSDTFILLTGYSPLELIGKSFADFLHPDDLFHHHHQQQQRQYYQQYHHHYNQMSPPWFRFYKKNGTFISLECKKGPNLRDEWKYVGVPGSDIHGAESEFQLLHSRCMNSSAISNIPHPSVIPTVNSPINLYKGPRDRITHSYMCMDCGTSTSPEWRRGPHGPKTLCNACGLRWAKKNKKK